MTSCERFAPLSVKTLFPLFLSCLSVENSFVTSLQDACVWHNKNLAVKIRYLHGISVLFFNVDG